jgi:hypothetical protein
MTLAISAPVIRTFEAVGLSFPRSVVIPLRETVPLPPCLVCHRHSHLPPAKLRYVGSAEDARVWMLCQDCDADDTDEEIDRKARSALGGSTAPPVAPKPAVGWVEQAARDWSSAAARQ